MSDAVQVISTAESPEQDTGRAEEQFCFVGPSTFPTDYVAYRTVVQTLGVDTRAATDMAEIRRGWVTRMFALEPLPDWMRESRMNCGTEGKSGTNVASLGTPYVV